VIAPEIGNIAILGPGSAGIDRQAAPPTYADLEFGWEAHFQQMLKQAQPIAKGYERIL
jgi:hypothetical protein